MHQFFTYLDFVPVMEARQQKYLIEAMSFPYMKEQDRKAVMRKYNDLDRKPQRVIATQKDIDKSWDLLRNRRRK